MEISFTINALETIFTHKIHWKWFFYYKNGMANDFYNEYTSLKRRKRKKRKKKKKK